jgi:exodeoxyribonuclease V alpha subunit
MSSETLKAVVERVTFFNEGNGFCVLRCKARGHRELLTVVGSAAKVSAGESIEAEGQWTNNKKHGLQFTADRLHIVAPTNKEGILKYLSSGMIKGIGSHYAKKLIEAFGEDVFDVIEQEPEKLGAIEGIGKKRVEQIREGWKEQKAIRAIMLFLHSYGVGAARAVRIYKTYGDQAISLIRENPYRLAQDVYGIGFKIADEFALKLGVERNSVIRARAGIHYALTEMTNRGHCAAFIQDLLEKSEELLGIEQATIQLAIAAEITEKNIFVETVDEQECLFPAYLYLAEVAVSDSLKKLVEGKVPWKSIKPDKAVAWVEKKNKFKLSDSQQVAVKDALNNKVMIITGGPGVGKTTIVDSLLKILKSVEVNIALAAPTGRAAKRLSETTGLTAKTIHRLLQYDPVSRGFKHHEANPLECDYLVVDETSMLDIVLFHHLLKALPKHAGLLLIGDVDQLPSVGAGRVLADCIDSAVIPTVKLEEIFRQAADSQIIINAHKINQGEYPSTNNEMPTDFFVIQSDNVEDILEKTIACVSHRIPKRFGFDPLEDIQVLTPMNRSSLGTIALNCELQRALNGHEQVSVTRFGTTFAKGDKVIQKVNNYDKDIFNGDIGIIRDINKDAQELLIDYSGQEIAYDFSDLDEISLAYAISIHKSQGSEFPVIVIPLAMQHYMMLARNLLYTGVTRGRKLVIVIAESKALAMAVKNAQTQTRLTRLAARLVS